METIKKNCVVPPTHKPPPPHNLFSFSFLFFLLKRGRFFYFKSFHHLWKRKKSPPQYFLALFLLSEKKSPSQISLVNTSILSIWFPYKKMKNKNLVTRLFRYLRSSVMFAGPEMGDHFTLTLHNNVIPHLKF